MRFQKLTWTRRPGGTANSFAASAGTAPLTQNATATTTATARQPALVGKTLRITLHPNRRLLFLTVSAPLHSARVADGLEISQQICATKTRAAAYSADRTRDPSHPDRERQP